MLVFILFLKTDIKKSTSNFYHLNHFCVILILNDLPTCSLVEKHWLKCTNDTTRNTWTQTRLSLNSKRKFLNFQDTEISRL